MVGWRLTLVLVFAMLAGPAYALRPGLGQQMEMEYSS
jgi:hypothetical protein